MISGAIMAHERRRVWAEDLSAQTGLPIVWDRINSVWDTARRSWEQFDPEATHHLVLQDDAVLCRDLMPTLSRLIEHTGNHPVCLTAVDYRLHGAKGDYERAVARGDRIWYSWNSVSAVGLLIPTRDIPEMIAFGQATDKVYHDDWRIRQFYKQRRIRFAFPIPSLIQHRHADENPSLLRGHDDKFPDRTSSTFIGEDRSGLTIDWSKKEPPEMGADMITYRNRATGEQVSVPVGSKAAALFAARSRWEAVPQMPVRRAEIAQEPPKPSAPPRTGAGSSRAVWEAYAHFLGIATTPEMSRSDIMEAVDAHSD